MTIASFVYVLTFFTTAVCAGLLLRGYFRTKKALLLWSGLCFGGLAVSNFLVFVDLILLPQKDLYLLRLFAAASGMALLMYGLIWESKS